MFSNEDLEKWHEFKKKCIKTTNFNSKKMSEKSKIFLRKIKSNIINNQDIEKFEDINLDYENDFILEKGKTLGIDRLSDRKLTLGKYTIDAQIDLHGLTLNDAYNKVKLFFDRAVLNKYRCILIVTGKGTHSTNITIKESMINWLKEPYFSNKIIKYTDANIKHGGNGAIYILLKNI